MRVCFQVDDADSIGFAVAGEAFSPDQRNAVDAGRVCYLAQ